MLYHQTSSLPLFTGGRIRSNIAVQTSRQREAVIGYQSTVLNALEEVENALVSYSQEQERRDRRSLLVAEALGKLRARRRQVIEMYFLEELSDAEISLRIGGSVGAIRVLRFRALEELRRLLEASADSDLSWTHDAPPHGDDA